MLSWLIWNTVKLFVTLFLLFTNFNSEVNEKIFKSFSKEKDETGGQSLSSFLWW